MTEMPQIASTPHPVAGHGTDDAARHPLFVRALDRALAVQRPVVLAHIRSVRLRNPGAAPDQVVRMLERRYLLAITGGGAAVGATAVIPAISTPVTLALSGVETIGFLESTALFAQSVAEVHGIPVENPDRARLLVMTLMLGEDGVNLVNQFARQATGKGATRPAFWGEVITKTLPRNMIGPVLDRLQHAFLRHFGGVGGASFLGKALPFGIGAAVGGAGNHILGRRVVSAARRGFGPAPRDFAPGLEPKEGAQKIETRLLHGARVAGGSIVAGAGAVTRTVKRAARVPRRRAKEVAADGTASEEIAPEEIAAEPVPGLPAAD